MSVLALSVSVITAWLTLIRSGTITMTQPTVIFFGPDSPRSNELALPKVYLRTLLFATSKRGRVIESMYVALSRNETRQNFNIWVYGDGKLVRGSGLFVGETGVEANHHFLIPRDGSAFCFTEGRYRLEVFAKLLGDQNHEDAFLADSRGSTTASRPSRGARFRRLFRLGTRFFPLPATRGQEAGIAGSRRVPGHARVSAASGKRARIVARRCREYLQNEVSG